MSIKKYRRLFAIGYVAVSLGMSAITLIASGQQVSSHTNLNVEESYIQKSEECFDTPCSSSVKEAEISSETEQVVKSLQISDCSVNQPQNPPAVIVDFPKTKSIQQEAQPLVVEAQPEDVDLNVSCFEDMQYFQINKSYNIPAEFYYSILPEEMQPLVEPVCQLEHEQNISSIYLLAVAATEVGWGTSFYESGSNNWFNWTADAVNYQWFDSAADCVAYTADAYQERMFNPEWYASFGQSMDDCFTIPEVNTRYALLPDGEVNWYWSEVVCEIAYNFIEKYYDWRSIDGL